MKARFILFISMLICFFASCDDDHDRVCDTENPLAEIQWLKETKENIESNNLQGQIIMYEYREQTVFWIDDCYQCADKLIRVFNCEGEVICEFGGIDGRNTCPGFLSEAEDSTMLYSSIP